MNLIVNIFSIVFLLASQSASIQKEKAPIVEKVKRKSISINGFKITNNAILVPKNKLLLIKDEAFFAAITFTKKITRGDGGYEYNWYYIPRGKGDLKDANTLTGSGIVFENYKRKKGKDRNINVKNIDGELFIKFQNVNLEWSKSRWVYFPSSALKTKLSITDTEDINSIDFNDADIKWYSRDSI